MTSALNILDCYRRAECLWLKIQTLTDKEIYEVVDLNANVADENAAFVWKIIKCKIKARQKAKTKMGAKQ